MATDATDTLSIRTYGAADEQAVAQVWYRSGKAEYTYLPDFQALDEHTAREVFRDIVQRNDVWVVRLGDVEVAFLAMTGSYIDRLYVLPEYQRRGIGKRLLAFARERSPAGLELHTHQQNRNARTLYEAQGFVAVRFGVSPPPENVPDVEYHWRP